MLFCVAFHVVNTFESGGNIIMPLRGLKLGDSKCMAGADPALVLTRFMFILVLLHSSKILSNDFVAKCLVVRVWGGLKFV